MNLFKTYENGFNKDGYDTRLEEYGKNIVTNRKKKIALYFIAKSFKEKFVLILLLLSI